MKTKIVTPKIKLNTIYNINYCNYYRVQISKVKDTDAHFSQKLNLYISNVENRIYYYESYRTDWYLLNKKQTKRLIYNLDAILKRNPELIDDSMIEKFKKEYLRKAILTFLY